MKDPVDVLDALNCLEELFGQRDETQVGRIPVRNKNKAASNTKHPAAGTEGWNESTRNDLNLAAFESP